MSVDRISNMLSSLKNAVLAGNEFVEIPLSRQCEAIAKVLEGAGFVEGVKVFKLKDTKRRMLHIDLAREKDGRFKLNEIKRVSKPGKRVYRKVKELKPVQSGFGLLILSTPRGVMSADSAKKKKLGGEVICELF